MLYRERLRDIYHKVPCDYFRLWVGVGFYFALYSTSSLCVMHMGFVFYSISVITKIHKATSTPGQK